MPNDTIIKFLLKVSIKIFPNMAINGITDQTNISFYAINCISWFTITLMVDFKLSMHCCLSINHKSVLNFKILTYLIFYTGILEFPNMSYITLQIPKIRHHAQLSQRCFQQN